MRLYCITHDRPAAFVPALPVTYVSSVPLPGHAGLVVPEDNFGGALAEYGKLFVIADSLGDSDPDELVYLFQYRKFLALRPGVTRSINAPWAFVSGAEAAEALFPTSPELDELGGRMLLGEATNVGTIAA